jgi:hypothetical protein
MRGANTTYPLPLCDSLSKKLPMERSGTPKDDCCKKKYGMPVIFNTKAFSRQVKLMLAKKSHGSGFPLPNTFPVFSEIHMT